MIRAARDVVCVNDDTSALRLFSTVALGLGSARQHQHAGTEETHNVSVASDSVTRICRKGSATPQSGICFLCSLDAHETQLCIEGLSRQPKPVVGSMVRNMIHGISTDWYDIARFACWC